MAGDSPAADVKVAEPTESTRAYITTQSRHHQHSRHHKCNNSQRHALKVDTRDGKGSRSRKGKVLAAAARRSPQIGLIALVIALIVVVELQLTLLIPVETLKPGLRPKISIVPVVASVQNNCMFRWNGLKCSEGCCVQTHARKGMAPSMCEPCHSGSVAIVLQRQMSPLIRSWWEPQINNNFDAQTESTSSIGSTTAAFEGGISSVLSDTSDVVPVKQIQTTNMGTGGNNDRNSNGIYLQNTQLDVAHETILSLGFHDVSVATRSHSSDAILTPVDGWEEHALSPKQQQPWRSLGRSKFVTRTGGSNSNAHGGEEAVKSVRILCWVLATTKSMGDLHTVQSTWGKRCNKLILFKIGPNISNSNHPHHTHQKDAYTHTDNVETFRLSFNPPLLRTDEQYHVKRVILAWQFVHERYGDQFDWFLRAELDTYILVDNLRYYLNHNPAVTDYMTKPLYVGRVFRERGGKLTDTHDVTTAPDTTSSTDAGIDIADTTGVYRRVDSEGNTGEGDHHNVQNTEEKESKAEEDNFMSLDVHEDSSADGDSGDAEKSITALSKAVDQNMEHAQLSSSFDAFHISSESDKVEHVTTASTGHHYFLYNVGRAGYLFNSKATSLLLCSYTGLERYCRAAVGAAARVPERERQCHHEHTALHAGVADVDNDVHEESTGTSSEDSSESNSDGESTTTTEYGAEMDAAFSAFLSTSSGAVGHSVKVPKKRHRGSGRIHHQHRSNMKMMLVQGLVHTNSATTTSQSNSRSNDVSLDRHTEEEEQQIIHDNSPELDTSSVSPPSSVVVFNVTVPTYTARSVCPGYSVSAVMSHDDVVVACLLHLVGVTPITTSDAQGRERFNNYSFGALVSRYSHHVPSWSPWYKRSSLNTRPYPACCAPRAISFHKSSLRAMEHLISGGHQQQLQHQQQTNNNNIKQHEKEQPDVAVVMEDAEHVVETSNEVHEDKTAAAQLV